MKVCKIEECEKKPHGRGWCRPHYMRWWRHGDPTIETYVRQAGPPEERILDKFLVGDGCWEWTAAKQTNGYGQFFIGDGQWTLAHRFVYEWLFGPIPEGLELDHLCSNRGCVNPEHLEPVTHAENLRRARVGAN